MHSQPFFFRSLALSLLAVGLSTSAHDWPHWRGPQFDGSAPEQALPTTFSKTEGIAWTAAMPGEGASTPIIVGDRVFLSSVDNASRSLLAICLDRRTGRELWRHTVADGDRKDDRSNFASPSPVSDGSHVWFFYGQGEMLAYTLDGKEVWRRNIQRDHGAFAFLWTFSTSPLWYDGKLYLQVLQRNVPVQGRGRTDGPNESYLLAIDPLTGRDLWRQVRPSEAREESLEAFSSPVPFQFGGRTEILISGGDCLTGHDPATGRELWRWGTWNPTRITHWRLVPSPVAGGGVILGCGPKDAPIFAIKAGQSGTLPDSGYAWQSPERELSSDVSTPLFYRGRFFVLNKSQSMLLCADPATGKVLWKGQLPSRRQTIESSPTAADGKIYFMDFAGTVYVVDADASEFRLLHTANMGGEADRSTRSSIAIAQGQLFIRTTGTLYAVGPRG
ncbi:MAG: PQQ-binding-like beta-propeller repeat protein [Verrucomicrobiae bacterium]|nr:PQQ-binding-like beta-propeller repeat protein [Verrucomicrobiae bacterium]